MRMISDSQGFIACYEGICGLVRFKKDERNPNSLILEQIWKGKKRVIII